VDDDELVRLLACNEDDVTLADTETLWREAYPDEVFDLQCPDCPTGKLRLRESKYGPFYGCSFFDSTGCKGSVSADTIGSPRGIPAPAATRALRKQAMALYERLKKQRGWNAAAIVYGAVTGKPVGMLDEDEARTVVHAIQHDLGMRTVWARLLEED